MVFFSIPFHRIEMIDMQGQSLGPCSLLPRYETAESQNEAQELIQYQNTLVPDSFASMLYDSNAYRGNYIFPARNLAETALIVLHPIYGVVYSIIALAKLIFHTFILTYRSIQLCTKASYIAEKKYLENNYPLNQTNINFLNKRLSYLIHRDEAIGNLIILASSILMTIPLIGLMLPANLNNWTECLLRHKSAPSYKYFIHVYNFQNQQFGRLEYSRQSVYYRTPTEKTFLIEKLAECEEFKEIDGAIENVLNEPEDSRIVDSYNRMDEGLIEMIHHYAKNRLKKEYWQKETSRWGWSNGLVLPSSNDIID